MPAPRLDGSEAPPWFREPTFGQRILGAVIDAVVSIPVFAMLGVLAEGQSRTAMSLALVAFYEIGMVVTRGQTFGKMAMGTRVADLTTGELPSLGQAAMRWFTVIAASLVAMVVPGLDGVAQVYALVVLVPIMRRPLHRGLHDLAAGTVVSSTNRTSRTPPH